MGKKGSNPPPPEGAIKPPPPPNPPPTKTYHGGSLPFEAEESKKATMAWWNYIKGYRKGFADREHKT